MNHELNVSELTRSPSDTLSSAVNSPAFIKPDKSRVSSPVPSPVETNEIGISS